MKTKNVKRMVTAATIMMGALPTMSAFAGLPSIYREPPKNLQNPNAYPVIAAQDDANPKVASQRKVFYYPTGKTEMKIDITNFNNTVLGPDGKRGGLCSSFDTTQKTLNILASKVQKLSDQLDAETDPEKIEQLGRILDRIRSTTHDTQQNLEWFGTVSGGNLAGAWDDGYREAKKSLEALNPGLTVEQLPRKQLNIYVGGAESVGKVPFSFGYTASGLHSSPAETQGQMTAGVTKNTVDQNGNNNGNYFSLLKATPFSVDDTTVGGSSGAVSMELTVPGACATLVMKENQTGTPGIIATVSDVFPNGANTRVKASYNAWRIYKKVHEAGSSSSWFGLSRTNYDRTWEDIKEGDDFRFEFYGEDPVDSAHQDEIRAELKAELAQRIAGSFGTMQRDGLPAVAIPASRLGSIFAPIVYTPVGFYGTLIVNALDVMFGSSQAASSIQQNWDRTVSEEWGYTRITPMVVSHTIVLKL